MAELALKRRVTFDDLRDLSPDDFSGELERGVWVPVARATLRHGQIMFRVSGILGSYLAEHPVGDVASGDAGVELSHDPDTLRGPDLAFVSRERLPGGEMPDDWFDEAPDLAIEIVSKSQSMAEVVDRARDFLAAGSRAAWVLDPRRRRVAVLLPPGEVRLLREEDEVDGGDVLPGFRCRVGRFFE